MKLVLVSVGALLVGLGIGVGVAFMRAPSPKVATHTAADSSAVAAHGNTAASGPDSAQASSRAPADTSARATAVAIAADTAHSEHGTAPTTLGMPPLAHPIPDSLTTPTYRPVARLLMNMKPADAGRVLSYLNDTQVEGILRALGARQAAVLLSQMPAERAAQLSRRLMLPVGGGT